MAFMKNLEVLVFILGENQANTAAVKGYQTGERLLSWADMVSCHCCTQRIFRSEPALTSLVSGTLKCTVIGIYLSVVLDDILHSVERVLPVDATAVI